jgi:hypothetical protein
MLNDLWREGNRKLGVVYTCIVLSTLMGTLACIIGGKDIIVATLGAVFGVWVALSGWYNESNVREHKIKSADGE